MARVPIKQQIKGISRKVVANARRSTRLENETDVIRRVLVRMLALPASGLVGSGATSSGNAISGDSRVT